MKVHESSSDQSLDAIYTRLRIIGQAGRIVCSILLVGAVIALILGAACVLKADVVSFEFGFISVRDSSSLPGKAAVLLADVVVWVFFTLAVWMARRLFANFAEGEVLTTANGRLLRWMGVWSFVAGIAALVPDALLFGLFLLALGWAMELAASVKQDLDLTI